LIIAAIIGSTGSTRAEAGLKFRAGVGYEFLSQEFFLDSLAQAGADTLEISTQLKTIYLDDFKGRLNIDYLPYADYRLEIRSVIEQSPDQYRLRLATNYRPRFGPVRFDWSSELERRDGTIDSVLGDPGYLSGSGRAKLSLALSDRFTIWSRAKSDFVQFDSVGLGTFDYYRLGGELGVSQRFNDFSSLSLAVFTIGREVSDTTDLDYQSYGLDGSLYKFYSRGEVNLLWRYETRDYDRSAEAGDYRRAELSARNRHSLSRTIFAIEELRVENITFDTSAYFSQDYTRIELTLMAGLSSTSLTFSIGPDFEWLDEPQSDTLLTGEEYAEYGIKGQLDILKPGSVFATLESITGRRDIKDEGDLSDLHSDFRFERLNLLADWTVGSGLSLSVLFSADWEWHKNSEENSRLFLLSSSIQYAF
jgi:hypothetical protein